MSIVKKGMRGAPVKRLQEKLGIAADGVFGPGTEKALRDYQASAGLAADGIAGPDTFTAIGLGELVLLRVGTRGEAVRKLQSALGISADGKFGPATAKAVKDYQAANGLTADGIAGPATLAKLGAIAGITAETAAKAVPTPEEKAFEREPMPEIEGTKIVTGSVAPAASKTPAQTPEPEDESVWSHVKGWFS